MAKKTKSFSHIEAQDALERLNEAAPTGEELVYALLRIFCSYGDGNIRRIREGTGNKAKDGRTVLVAKVIAYRPKGALDFYDEIKAMQADKKIVKHAPRLYAVSDGKTIVAVDPKEQDIYENEVALMWKDFDFFYPLAGIEKIRNIEEAEADVKSAELMAKLFDEIRRHNDVKDKAEMHNLNVFMSRLLFCYFAEDTNLFPEPQLFTNSIRQHTAEDGHDLAEFIDRAFLAMSTDDRAVLDNQPKQFAIFPYVNGGLFEKRLPIPVLSRRARVLMIKCGDFDWKDINPDIFGSMIQAVVTPEMRSELGMHYTSVPNIMKLIRPLFLDGLNAEYSVAKDTKDIKRLRRLLARLGKIKFFDPACGSGNFLIVSYKRIRELEIRIWQALRELGSPEIPFTNVSLQQFYGIEIDDYACDTATLSLWLAEHQMNNEFNSAFNVRTEALPLRPSGHIVCGNACRIDWNAVCPHTAEDEVYVMGNPPYVGSRNQSEEQKADGKAVMGQINHYRKLDYIANWFTKGAEYIESSHACLAFVTTNSICQGEQVKILWDYILPKNIEISFAYEAFKWSNNAKSNAGVSVIIIGLANSPYHNKFIYSETSRKKCDIISPLLTSKNEIIISKSTTPISKSFPEMRRGNMPNDQEHLRLSPAQREDILKVYPEAERFIRLQIGADELINNIERYCFWIPDEDFDKAYSIKPISEAIEKVRKYRINSKDKTLHAQANKPHQFREFFECNKNSLVIPIVSSERRPIIPISFVPNKTIVPNSAQVIYNANDFIFAVLTSKMHNLWVRKTAGRLENRFRYSIFLCYNTFPFPEISKEQKNELEKLATKVIAIRENNYDIALGVLYNPETMPDELKEAHHNLDLAVERCYRPEPFASDEERLECLFKLYVKMTKK